MEFFSDPKGYFRQVRKQDWKTVLVRTLPVILAVTIIDFLLSEYSVISDFAEQTTSMGYDAWIIVLGLLLALFVIPWLASMFMKGFGAKSFFENWKPFLYVAAYFGVISTIINIIANLLYIPIKDNPTGILLVSLLWIILGLAILIIQTIYLVLGLNIISGLDHWKILVSLVLAVVIIIVIILFLLILL